MPIPIIKKITGDFPKKLVKDIDILMSSLDYNPIWQTIEWQMMLKKTKYVQESFFIGISKDKNLGAYALLEKRSIGFGKYGFFCIGGPVGEDAKSLEILSREIKKLSIKEKVIFTQIEPLSPIILPEFSAGYYKNFIEKHTAIIDLKQDNEAILARMKPKWRYNIRVAEKAEVKVEQVPFSEENLGIFYNLLRETLERDEFAANSPEYFRVFLQYLEKQELGGLFIAKREEKVIAAGIFVFYKETALYYYGASSSDNTQRKYMASYLLQWEAIQKAQKRGCKVFDFLGIADPSDSKSVLAGVTDFKLKLTDKTRVWPTSQILVPKRFVYLIFTIKKTLKIWKSRLFG